MSSMMYQIRCVTDDDFQAIWPIFQTVVRAGETYAYALDTSYAEAEKIWMQVPQYTFVVEEAGQILATYYLKPNQQGPGSHVCNCGYMVSEAARGRGLAQAMCEHSQQLARELGYLAMQFNLVVASNTGAVKLWEKLGFDKVGCLPRAFQHPTQGLVDAFVMYKWLGDD